MPGHSTADLDRMVAGLLDAARPIRGQYSGHVTSLDQSEDTGWPHSLNSLVDTLRPEAAAPLISSAASLMTQRPRMATLHSEVTQETVVLHAASNEDEADDDVLVVADDDHHCQEPVSRSHHDLHQPPVIRSGLNTPPQVDKRPQQPPAVTKPPTYVPIPSKKDKSKTTISPSGFTANPARHPQGLGLSPSNVSLTPDFLTSPKSRPLEIKPKPRTPVKVVQREASTRVSRVSAAPLISSAAPLISDTRPRTTEIRPVTSVMEASPVSAPPLVFPCPICHERFLGQV